MNKSYLIGGLLLWAATSLKAQDTLFVCDFENGMPETFSLYDRDGNEPSRSMKRYGLENGVAWAAYAEEGTEGNTVAYSGSWYKEVAQSDDWMVTPVISVTDARAILSWRACAVDAEHPDGYSVYVSETGNAPEHFTANPVFTVAGENSAWEEHFLSLEAYAGKQIYVAFVNNSTNCNLLMVDDIVVQTRKHTFSFTNLTPEAVTTAGGVKVTGTLTSSGFLPVEGYKLELTHGGETFVVDRSTESIAPDSMVTISFEQEIDVALNTTEDYTLIVSSMEGEDADTIQGSITCFERMVLIEEGTGTWCMWCPRGQYGLQQLHKNRPGEFIDVAVHVSDPMMVTDYAMSLYAPFFATYGLPSCVMDRKSSLIGDPYMGVEERLDQARAQGTIGRFIDLRAEAYNVVPVSRSGGRPDGFKISGSYEFGKAVKEGEYRLSFILVEDSVTGYSQSNGYSGSSEAMGGLDLLPDPIPAGEYYFANVGRAVCDSTNWGTRLLVNAQTGRHIPIYFCEDYNFYPESICDFNKVKLVALIVDEKTGEIVNAAETPLPFYEAEGVGKTVSSSSILLQGNTVTATSPIRQVEVWSVGGQLLHQALPESLGYTLPEGVEKRAAVIVKVRTDGETRTFRCIR